MVSLRSEETELREFGSLVARTRIDQGKTGAELSEAIGIGESSLSRIENGNRECRLGIMRLLNVALDGALSDPIKLYLNEGRFR